MSPFLKTNGKIYKSELKKLDNDSRSEIDSLLNIRFEIRNELSKLKETGSPNRNDSIISTWGSVEVINLDNYYRQYQVFSDSSGTFLLVHCICESLLTQLITVQKNDSDIWKTNLLTVHDGGVCFFKMIIHIEKLERSHVMMNRVR